MPKLSSMPKAKTQRVLVYGPPKTGKTELAGKLSTHFNLLYFGLENGHATMQKYPAEQQERIEVINLPDTRTFPIGIQTMLKVIKGGEHSICDTHGSINCPACRAKNAEFTRVNLSEIGEDTIVVIDSLTQLTNSAIAHITKNQPEDYKLQQDDWGNLGKLMDMFLSHVQQAPFNIICISHETETEMEDGKMKIVPTAGTRNFSRNSAKYFDHVVYCQISNMRHTFKSNTTSTVNIVVGSRTDMDLDKMQIPSLLPIFTGEMPAAQESPGKIAAGSLAGLLGKK